MTTIAEDLKTTIDTDWDEAGITKTTYVFMKTDPDTVYLEPPNIPDANKATIVIFEGIGIPIRRSFGADLIVYEGELIVYTPTYANMITTLAELKQIADDLTTGTGDLSLTVPMIIGDINESLFHATIRYKWEKLTTRG